MYGVGGRALGSADVTWGLIQFSWREVASVPPQVSPEAPQGATAQAYTAAPQEKGSATPHRLRRQALPAPWATPLTPFSTVDKKAALGAGPARSECALPSVIRAQPLHVLGSS